MKLAGEIRSSGIAVTPVVHEHKRLGIELAMLTEGLKASGVGRSSSPESRRARTTRPASCSPCSRPWFGMERKYIRDRPLEGHESARKRGKTIRDPGVTDNDMLSMALHLRDQELSLHGIAKRLVISTDVQKGHQQTA